MLIALKMLGTRLLGRLQGKRDYAKVCEELAAAPAGETVVLDFRDVELLSGSWANAMLVPLYRLVAEDQVDLFPVLANIGPACLDDLLLVAEWNHQCYLHAKVVNGKPIRAVLLGSLDPGQESTLKAVMEHGETTGAALQRVCRQGSPKATAWNNRLKDLYLKRLLRRRKQGREMFYTPIVKEITFNG